MRGPASVHELTSRGPYGSIFGGTGPQYHYPSMINATLQKKHGLLAFEHTIMTPVY